ncbi:hypothetical protein NBRC116589_42330 [Ruegeria sp. HU-ET01832]
MFDLPAQRAHLSEKYDLTPPFKHPSLLQNGGLKTQTDLLIKFVPNAALGSLASHDKRAWPRIQFRHHTRG